MEGFKAETTFLITGNKKHFPVNDFIVSLSEFPERISEL